MNDTSLNSQTSKNVMLTRINSDNVITHEVSEEFSLPDYVPEVRRVLHTRASVLPEGRFISDSGANTSVEFDGTVTYNVIYTDDEGKLCSTPLSSSYEGQTVITGHPDNVFIDTGVDSVICRVTAPRRLIIKTRLKSRLLSFADDTIEENISPRSLADEMYIERKQKKLNTVSLKSIFMQNIRMSDRFDLSGKEDLTPIMCDAQMVITECRAHNGTVAARGYVNVSCVCADKEREITVNKSLPVYEELEAEGATPTDVVRCVGRCVSLSISNEQNNDVSSLFFDVSCEIEGEFYRNEENLVTEDCYSTKHETEASYKTIDTYSVVLAKNSSFSINDKFKRKDPSIDSIVYVLCDVSSEKSEHKNGKLSLLGKVNATVIGKSKNDDSSGEYISEGYEIPFRYDLPCEGSDIITRVSYTPSLTGASYENDKFCISMEMYPSVSAFSRDECRILDSAIIKKDKEFKKDAACVRVFFPKDCDILWEVAKKFHTTERKIVEDNSLSAYSLENVKSIII